jgi:ribosomal protein S18 acetylase RimI-like enzyme
MIIQHVEDHDIPELAALEAATWGEAGAGAETIRTRAEIFRDGSLIARLPSGSIGGYVVVQRVDSISTASWSVQTDNGGITRTHCPSGRLLYGVNLSVLPEGARHGVSRALIEHCYRVFVASGACAGICLGSRVPGFARWARANDPKIGSYLALRSRGLSFDPEIRIYEKNGFRILWELRDYFEDPASLNFGVMLLRS